MIGFDNEIVFVFSLNPRLDLGQLEGGFMMGYGMFLLEDFTLEPNTGSYNNPGTWVSRSVFTVNNSKSY